MRIQLIAVGTRMPDWVTAGYAEYAKRMPRECSLELTEIAAGKRSRGSDIDRLLREEGERVLAAIPKSALPVALEVEGRPWSTGDLAKRLGEWLQGGRDVALLVGGPEGLAPAVRQRAETQWSLSPLTLPHPLVRVIIAEQIYRAWSILQGHPYHR